MSDHDLRDYYERRKGQLKLKRTSFISHYKDLSQFTSPRRGRFDIHDVDKGQKRHQFIVNSAGTQALTTATSGMFAGTMSPARPWFEIGVEDTELNNFRPVKIWNRAVERGMRSIFSSGNLYRMSPVLFKELLLFGTGCMTHVDDEEDVARFYSHTAGAYMIGTDDRLKVNTLIREYTMTAEQMALEFGLDNLSVTVKKHLDQNNLNAMIPVTHIIEPNDDFRESNLISKFKKFRSAKYETGDTDKDTFLSQKGFDDFPAYVPRWATTEEDTYGTDCPGMVALGDIKQLQTMEKRGAQGLDKMVNPPLTGPGSLRQSPVSSLPGGLTLYDADPSRNKLEPIYNVNLPLEQLERKIEKVTNRIDRAFFNDLFRAITDMEGIQPRNELELNKVDAERLLMLGPVLESVQEEFHDQLISRTFNQMVKRGLIPPPPQEIIEQKLKVKYIGSLAIAQRAVDARPIERYSQYSAGLVAAGLSDGKKFNGDAAQEKFAELNGVPPELVTPDDEIAEQRQLEAQQQQLAQGAELAEQLGRAAASAGQVNLDENTPVSQAVDQINRQRGN